MIAYINNIERINENISGDVYIKEQYKSAIYFHCLINVETGELIQPIELYSYNNIIHKPILRLFQLYEKYGDSLPCFSDLNTEIF